MSAAAVQRLENLLARVQARREQPRTARAEAGAPVLDEGFEQAEAAPPTPAPAPQVAYESDSPDMPTLPPSELEMDSEPPEPTQLRPAAQAPDELSFEGVASSSPAPPETDRPSSPASPLTGAVQRLSHQPQPTEAAAEPEPLAPEAAAPEPQPPAPEAAEPGSLAPPPEAPSGPEAATPAPEPQESEARPSVHEAPTGLLSSPSAEIAHQVPQASGPVAVEQGEAPAREVLSFEDVIARSLSLRARD